MALESKVLMVAISPSRPDAQADASAVEYRVDTFIEGLKMVTKQGNAIIVFDKATSAESCRCDIMRVMYCKCNDSGKCTCPRLMCDSCRAMALIDPEKCAVELKTLYAAHTSRLHAASTIFLSMSTLHADFAHDTKQPSPVFRRI